ncbi:MAG: hypothetical protein IID06_12525 [Gemmatimonadetes bacterium]|nr:hypothetical protein [Gemmatimonadota bacterium]
MSQKPAEKRKASSPVDFGEILFMLLIGSGILSSILGKKKKKSPQTSRPRPQPARQEATLPERPRVPRVEPSLDPSHSGPVPSRMEEILRQLGLEVEPRGEEAEVPEQAPEIATVGERDAFGREMPRVVSLEEPSVEAIVPEAEKRHDEFHEEYIREFRQTRIHRAVSRGHEILNPKSLRQAILMHEILGPPKGLR